jgi:hypothetical protein
MHKHNEGAEGRQKYTTTYLPPVPSGRGEKQAREGKKLKRSIK